MLLCFRIFTKIQRKVFLLHTNVSFIYSFENDNIDLCVHKKKKNEIYSLNFYKNGKQKQENEINTDHALTTEYSLSLEMQYNVNGRKLPQCQDSNTKCIFTLYYRNSIHKTVYKYILPGNSIQKNSLQVHVYRLN